MLKNINKTLLLVLVLIFPLALLASCGTPEEKSYRVMVSLSEGAHVLGENPVSVKEGGSAVFAIDIDEGYAYESSEGAVYSHEDGTLTVSSVTKNTNIDFIVKKIDYNPEETFVYVFKPSSSLDTSSVAPGPEINAGTSIKLSALDTTRVFRGWSLNYTISGGGSILSSSREFEFVLTPELTTDGVLRIFANYQDVTGISYDANGGKVNKDTPNMSSEYYTVMGANSTLSVTYEKEYLSYFECASSFYDDGTFTREGYVLCEYNTSPDGTGTAYSLGSKVPLVKDGSPVTLYCIWSPDSPHADFTYKDITVPYPDKVTEKHAPHWVSEGIMITSYKGNDKTVTVPEKIDGKTVIAIAAGAFVDKDVETLVLSRRLIKVENNAFLSCDSLTTVYYPDGLYEMNDEAFDKASYTSFKNFYVNATLAPRFTSADVGALAVKLSRLLAESTVPRVVMIGGSSALQGVSSEYLEALLDNKVRFVNFGTTRTTHGAMYLEAMGALCKEEDIILYSPENSSYMFGESKLYYKTFRDLEGMNNIYRYVDFSNYTGMFSSMTELNKTHRYTRSPASYEAVAYHGELTKQNPTYTSSTTNKYGDFLRSDRAALSVQYHDTYFITLNERVKSRDEGDIYGEQQIENKDYTNLDNITWATITDAYFKDNLNRSILAAKKSGARVYFSFCPIDASSLVDGAESAVWQAKYNKLIDDTYVFDGRMGSVSSYIFNHVYFYDCAFHPNDYGRVFRTYRLYLDLAPILDLTYTKGLRDEGTDFAGCLFEFSDKNGPILDPYEN